MRQARRQRRRSIWRIDEDFITLPEVFYLIPESSPPYSVTNKHRPLALDSIIGQVNVICKNIPTFNAFICKVNCSLANHDFIAAQAGVRQLPANITWQTVISTLNTPTRNFIQNLCTDLGIAYDITETIGELLNRICMAADLGIGATSTSAQYNTLTQTQKDKIAAFANKWGKQPPGQNETIKNLNQRLGSVMWDGSKTLPEVG